MSMNMVVNIHAKRIEFIQKRFRQHSVSLQTRKYFASEEFWPKTLKRLVIMLN
jgi:hypothetical protein